MCRRASQRASVESRSISAPRKKTPQGGCRTRHAAGLSAIVQRILEGRSKRLCGTASGPMPSGPPSRSGPPSSSMGRQRPPPQSERPFWMPSATKCATTTPQMIKKQLGPVGLEPPRYYSGNTPFSSQDSAESSAESDARSMCLDAIINSWGLLTADDRRRIIAIVNGRLA